MKDFILPLSEVGPPSSVDFPGMDSEDQLSMLGSMASVGFWSIDLDSDRAWASPHARSIFGLGSMPLMKWELVQAVHTEDRPVFRRAISAAVPQTEAAEMELRIVRCDDEVRWVTVKTCGRTDSQGRVSRVSGYVVDDRHHEREAAELLILQEKLTHLTRVALLGELSGALAHELQQPLTAILSNAQAAQLIVARVPIDTQELEEILVEIVSNDKHAGKIITGLRALLMRAERNVQKVDPAALVADVLALARGTLMERNVQVHTRIDPQIPPVLGNRVELSQVLLNLVLNACESMSGNAARDRRVEIVVACIPEQDVIRTSVIDCGKGIAEDQLERVFDPFFTTKEGGLGLGLSISNSIVTAHGGKLWAADRADRGTAFHFTLPVAASEANNG